MLVVHQKQFTLGIVLTVTFFGVLFVMFSPLFGGGNAFEAADKLFNSISKGSSYFVDKMRAENRAFEGKTIEVRIAVKEPWRDKARTLLATAGAEVEALEGGKLRVSADLGRLVALALDDSESLFHNRGEEVANKYGFPEKEALFLWWSAFKEMTKSFKEQEKFAEAAFLEEVMKKAVEVGYNYYGIEPKKASAHMGILSFALIFYVVYTLWWGYAILFLFDGLGLEMKAGAKKEV
jgi:hypothetical protein